MIDREQAGEIAAREILARGLGTGVGHVYLLEELTTRAPALYDAPDLRRCWIAYAERPLGGLASSMIVLIDRESGAVLHAGSANDEG